MTKAPALPSTQYVVKSHLDWLQGPCLFVSTSELRLSSRKWRHYIPGGLCGVSETGEESGVPDFPWVSYSPALLMQKQSKAPCSSQDIFWDAMRDCFIVSSLKTRVLELHCLDLKPSSTIWSMTLVTYLVFLYFRVIIYKIRKMQCLLIECYED